jgi:DNA primase
MRSRSFSANLEENVYRCFTCGSSGGTLELWAAVHGMSVYQAAEDLCGKVGIEVPWIKRW